MVTEATRVGFTGLSFHSIPHTTIPQKDKLTKLSSGYFVCIGPEGGPQGFPAFTTASLVARVGVFGGETGFEGGGFCATTELVVDELGAVVLADQTAFMGRLLCGEGFGRVGTHSMAAAGTGPE